MDKGEKAALTQPEANHLSKRAVGARLGLTPSQAIARWTASATLSSK